MGQWADVWPAGQGWQLCTPWRGRTFPGGTGTAPNVLQLQETLASPSKAPAGGQAAPTALGSEVGAPWERFPGGWLVFAIPKSHGSLCCISRHGNAHAGALPAPHTCCLLLLLLLSLPPASPSPAWILVDLCAGISPKILRASPWAEPRPDPAWSSEPQLWHPGMSPSRRSCWMLCPAVWSTRSHKFLPTGR